jgi:RecJ-like exonuclease
MDEKQEGIVTAIKMSGGNLGNMYNVIGNKAIQIFSDMNLELYDNVIVQDGKAKTNGDHASKSEYEEILSKLLASAITPEDQFKEKLSGKKYEKVIIKMLPELKKAALLLLRGFVSGTPIVVRFHNDGDGSAGGIAIYRALTSNSEKYFVKERPITWQINRSIAYTIDSLYVDKMMFDSHKSIERPIVVIVDFGTSVESIDAIKEAQGICDIIWLDHHIPYEGFQRELVKHYINVCDFGGDSNLTAGLLGCIFAQLISDVQVDDLKNAALISDYSTYADFSDQQGLKNSMLLDYLTSTSNEMNSKPKQMDQILKDRAKSDEVFRRVSAVLENAILEGIKNMRTYKNHDNINICVLDFIHIAKLGEDYPLPGRYCSKLQDTLESRNKGSTVTVVYYGSYISLRVSKDIVESLDLLGVIKRLNEKTNGAVTGGGHKQAASIRTSKDQIKDVLKLLLTELGAYQ